MQQWVHIPSLRAAYHSHLRTWYHHHYRELPWRAPPGHEANPYFVWLSEVMLQQTTVATVKDYFLRFVEKWPTVFQVAEATLDEIFHLWQGLGYYTRARNLHKTAQQIVRDYHGIFPSSLQDLQGLPGIGPYTAAAISSIAFGKPAPVVDGNIERVICRLFAIKTPLPKAKKEIREFANILTPSHQPGDYAQALMDLGATICTPLSPRCEICPIQAHCAAFQTTKDPSFYPQKEKKKPLPTLCATVYWIENTRGKVLIQKRPDQGLLAGLMEFPSSPWIEMNPATYKPECLFQDLGLRSLWVGSVMHTFTHFRLHLWVCKGAISKEDADGVWMHPAQFYTLAWPTLMKKVIRKIKDHPAT